MYYIWLFPQSNAAKTESPEGAATVVFNAIVPADQWKKQNSVDCVEVGVCLDKITCIQERIGTRYWAVTITYS